MIMRSALIWITLGGALVLFGGSVDAWSRQFFNRFNRNLFKNGDLAATPNNDLDNFNALFGMGSDTAEGGGGVAGAGAGPGGLGVGRDAIGRLGVGTGGGFGQQQQEVYGIVEPLIEDLPCVDRPCNVNEDCCPSGVCILSYGDGKCNYDFGRKRDLCRRHADCDPTLSCLKGPAGNLFCQSAVSVLGPATKSVAVKQFGEDCVTSSDCNVNKFQCCQLQRTHHRMIPKRKCAFFRDPFMCIDISPPEDEDTRDSRFLASFNQRLM